MDGPDAAVRRRRRRRARLVRVRRAAAARAWIATRPCASSPQAGVQSKPYLPAIHLMSFYRERFGHREGEFPVCEDVAARSLALPFFPGLSESRSRACAWAAHGDRALSSPARLPGGSSACLSTRARRARLSNEPSGATSATARGKPQRRLRCRRGGPRGTGDLEGAQHGVKRSSRRHDRRNRGSGPEQRRACARARPGKSSLPQGPPLPTFAQAAIWALRPLALMDRCAARYGEIFTLRVRGRPWVLMSNPAARQAGVHDRHDPLRAGAGEANPLLGAAARPSAR